MHQADESSFYLAIPEAPFRSFELIQRMAANRSLGQTVNAFRNLLEILKSHTNVEPIQHMLGTRRQLAMNCAQASVAVRENCHQSAFLYPALTERETSRIHRLGAALAHKGKTCGISMFVEHLAGDNLKVPFGSRVPGSDVSTIQA